MFFHSQHRSETEVRCWDDDQVQRRRREQTKQDHDRHRRLDLAPRPAPAQCKRDEGKVGLRGGVGAKPTYPNLGLDGARRGASELFNEALAAISSLGSAGKLLQRLAGYIVEREK